MVVDDVQLNVEVEIVSSSAKIDRTSEWLDAGHHSPGVTLVA
jgi:hypothetical protein